MIISYDFGLSLVEYAKKGINNEFPLFDQCPNCKCHSSGNLHRNGYYWRFGLTEEVSLRVPICRMKCLQCKVSFSILPDFFIPYFQHTIETILHRLYRILEDKKANGSRQLLRFHLTRYYKSIKWIHSFFVALGQASGFSKDIKKEAIKYMKKLQDFGESTFLRRSWGHSSSYFMAH
ncbi:DUF6431 domain-containing protein [Metabacillus sp. B2-18]|uniref:DUF6431 domain-containing protein n=1 Tax=Metabacillus sp. B2-18 TaxID=2897333 RepID=UPI001E3805F1|nr:DUF6431 domain-containing protein [Metabacillus sp. B2-18]UGB28785.1 DUF6431 domain-containing protein [Metabacillus sp. B2-18]UGB28914.1 DUF6431 domain-containing protein [Metabacillus sp. B2-18]UGB33667.1 DUF6431 domain-containing protein [Metabacillus sp. B2-18]UGB33755.1 DUF6431 domain-containing protein [Metabacillus sp. B2-18]